MPGEVALVAAGTAGENVKDQWGMDTWVKKKGTFEWDKNVVPTYSWYAGKSGQYLLGDHIVPGEVTKLNWPEGSREDPQAKIYPFKVMRGKQPYDKQREVIVVPKLFGKGGFWKSFDWADAVGQGMESVGEEFSGEVGFTETESWWKINHMVAPADQALKCADCHGPDGRMDWKALGYEDDDDGTGNTCPL